MAESQITRDDLIVETYSKLADKYDDEKNLRSCWGRAMHSAIENLSSDSGYRTVADLGCGTGSALVEYSKRVSPEVEIFGFEPAEKMRRFASERARGIPNIRVGDGRFENIPLGDDALDYLWSIMAFHWTTDLERSVAELRRVVRPGGDLDLIFIGRWNGRELIEKTSPIFLRFMGPKLLIESAKLRKQLERAEAETLFAKYFDPSSLSVTESYTTYYDSLEGHWGWWVRIEGQLVKIPAERKAACDEAVRLAMMELDTDQGIPYTLHAIHVRIRG